jgi:YD repeat-containing protein
LVSAADWASPAAVWASSGATARHNAPHCVTCRAVRTVYNDGSFTETLYGIGDGPVALDQEGEAIPTPTGWRGIPSGGSERVAIRQRKSGDTPVATYDVYDPAGNLVDVYQPAVVDGDPSSPTYGRSVNPLTQYAYDAAGNETTQTDADGHKTTFGYDQYGDQVRQQLPDNEVETSAYNANRQIVSSTDFDGNTATYTYFTSGPHAGMLEQVVYAGAANSGKATQTVTYGYDGLDRKTSVTDASGTTTDSYDDFGNLVEEQTP